MKQKKILYLMSVDWGWIAQRPHFLALELEKGYDLKLVFLKQYIKRWKSQKKLFSPPNSQHGVYIPLQERVELLQKISDFTMTKAIGNMDEYDAVVLGTPLMFRFIENFKGKIIYDCMDNYFALENDKKVKEKIRINEDKLIARADLIFASSVRLKEMLEKKDHSCQVELVRNGYNNVSIYPIKEGRKRDKYLFGYVGTVSSWMDFELLERCVESFGDVEMHLIGPAPGYNTQTKERIIFDGTVEHSQLYTMVQDYDCLIMPFVLNDIILAVDPVKLYEYICFGKCIISVYYDEVARFSDFVYFYHNRDEFILLVSQLKEQGFPPKYSESQQKEFLKNNSWEARGKTINESIECLWNETGSYKDVPAN